MTTCDAMGRLVSPYLDGELVGEDRAAFEAHVAGCSNCRTSLDREKSVVDAVRHALPLYEATPRLRRTVQDLLDEAARTRPPARSAARLHPRPAAWAAVAALVAVATALWWSASPPSAPLPQAGSTFAAVAVDAHLRHVRRQLPLEVRSESPEEVSRWFEGRVPFHLQLPDYPVGTGEEKPYRLTGGRLIAFQDDYAAYVAYGMEGRPISLLVTSASRVSPSGGEVVRSGSLAFHVESVAGLKVITWTDNGLTYALASDLAVGGARSCIVCHAASPSFEETPAKPRI